MVNLKTDKEIRAMRQGGQTLAAILEELRNYTEAGQTTSDLENQAAKLFLKYGVQASFLGYRGFPAHICTAVNSQVVHGIPNQTKINNGDIVSIDCGVLYENLHTDSAITFGIGQISPNARRLVEETTNALWAGIETIKPGSRIGDIGHAIYQHLKKNDIRIIEELVGHGVGHKIHEAPQVPNRAKAHSGLALKPGMTIAIEPITCLGRPSIETLDDNWTIVTRDGDLACQQEHTILVTSSGYEVLTAKS